MNWLQKIKKSSLLHNIAALGFVQVINYILPLMIIPYLISVLGVSTWGKIAFAQFVLQYFIVIISYGFQWSAVHELSINRSDKNKINNIFSATWGAQWILLGCSFTVLCILIFFIPKLYDIKNLLLVGFLATLGFVLSPTWLMQGIEELKALALFQSIGQVISFSLLFLLVKDNQDTLFAILFQSTNNIIAGIFCILFIYRKRDIKFHFPNYIELKKSFTSGWEFFKSQIWISLYTNTIPVILGFASTPTAVATYSIADKIQKAFRFLLNPVSQAIFPRIAFLYSTNKKDANKLLRRSLLFTSLVTGVGGVFIFLFSDMLVKILGGGNLPNSAYLLRCFSVMPIMVGLSGAIATQAMIPRNMAKALNRIWGSSAFFSLIVSYPICIRYGATGAVWLVIIVEFLILTAMILALFKDDKNFLGI